MDGDYVFMSCLYANSLLEGKTSLSAITGTLDSFSGSDGRFVNMFRDVAGRLAMGDSVRSSFASGIRRLRLRDKDLLRRLSEISECGDARKSIEGMFLELSHRRRMRLETGFGSLQKWLAVSLLASVVLPSLSLFGFIGYSMLYSAGAAFVAFSALLLSVFPVLNSLVQKRIRDIYA